MPVIYPPAAAGKTTKLPRTISPPLPQGGLQQSSPILWGTLAQRPIPHAQYLGWAYLAIDTGTGTGTGNDVGTLYVCTKETGQAYQWQQAAASTAADDAGTATGGTYTPTVTIVQDITSVDTVYAAFYQRVGDVVQVTGKIDLTQDTFMGLNNIRVSLPVASDLAAVTDLHGTGYTTGDVNLTIYAGTANNDAHITWVAPSGVATTVNYNFMYRVL